MLKAVIDTNIWVSALMNSSLTRPILNAFINADFTPVMSNELLKELNDTLNKPKIKRLIPANDAKEFIALIDDKSHKFEPVFKLNACRDSKDNFILALSIETKTPLVSLDKDILILKESKKFKIFSPREFLELLKK